MKKKKITYIGRSLFVILSLVFLSLYSQAQSPAANISGPLKAVANGTNITITCQIANGLKNPGLTYSFQNNTSGAVIVSKGKYIYNPNTDAGTQTIEINPGSSAGSFIIMLEVETTNGIGKCSKSVVVTKGNTGN